MQTKRELVNKVMLALVCAVMSVPLIGLAAAVPERHEDADMNYAYMRWGAVEYTHGDFYTHPCPVWVLYTYRVGGEWSTDPEGWYVLEGEKPGVGALWVELNRERLPATHIRYRLRYADHPDGELYLDLLDTAGAAVVSNAVGNLMGGAVAIRDIEVNIPIASSENAWVVSLRRGKGAVRVYEGLLYVAEEGDLMGDWAKVYLNGTDPALDAVSDQTAAGRPSGDAADAACDMSEEEKRLRALGRNPNVGVAADIIGKVNLVVGTVME